MILLFGLQACSKPLDAVKFGKKCLANADNSVTYSYVWLYNKENGLPANKRDCDLIADSK